MRPSTTRPARAADRSRTRPGVRNRRPPRETGICHSYTPDGRCISLLKVLLTELLSCTIAVLRQTVISSRTRPCPLTVEGVVTDDWISIDRNYIEGGCF